MLNSIVPWGKKEKTPVVEEEEIVVYKGTTVQKAPTTGLAQVQSRSKKVMLAGKKVEVNPQQLIRCIKRITQNIGEYKATDDVYSHAIVTALRKARGDLVSILENEFHINWQISDSGESVFFMG